jgi:tRNA pseudouridine38-40 synthase
MDHNLKAIVRYDGTDFAGWQIQPDARTVQGEIEGALSRIASQPIRIQAAGRTDAGVHALGQVFSCHWPKEPDTDRLRRSLSSMLAPEIRVESIEVVPPDFNARFSATSKRYAYAISLTREPDPLSARYAWCVPWKLDIDRLAELATSLVGTHDFAGFQCSGSDIHTTVRTLYAVKVLPGGIVASCDARNLYRIELWGDGFLYKMVRNIAGLLVGIVRGATLESRFMEVLNAPGPFHGHTAPAHGLALVEVQY